VLRKRTEPHPSALHATTVDDLLVVSGPRLDEVLEEVGARLGPDAEILDVRREIVGGVAGFFGRERFTVDARAHGTATPAPVPAEGEEEAADEAAAAAPDGPLDGATFAAELARALREVDVAAEEPAAQLAVEPALEPALEPAVEPAVPEAAPIAPWDGARGAMLALAARDLSPEQVRDHLEDLVDELPALPTRGVVAVVGEGSDALAVAEGLAADAGIDPGDVLLASPDAGGPRPAWLTITDPVDAAARAARWHAADRLTILAVTMRPGLEGLEWTRALLDAVGAHQVRLAVPGWRHADEVAPRLQGLARVDAIDVCDPVEWPAAAGFLGLPIPVATIAGRPATLEVWSECLADAGVDARPAEVAP